MNQLQRFAVGVAMAVAVLVAGTTSGAPADAGGWVVVTVDEVPVVVAGESVDIGFTVLRHGVTPESSDDAVVNVVAADGTVYRFDARPEGPAGHHVVTIEVPAAGDFTWSVEVPAAMPSELGVLSVHAAGSASSGGWGWDVAVWSTTVLATLLGIAAMTMLLSDRRRPIERDLVDIAPT